MSSHGGKEFIHVLRDRVKLYMEPRAPVDLNEGDSAHFNSPMRELQAIPRAGREPESRGSAPWSGLPYCASAGPSVPAFDVLRERRERLAPSHKLPLLLRRCTGRGSTRSWPRSRRGPVQGRTRRTGGPAPTAPWEPSFRNASSPATCRPEQPRRMECRHSRPCNSECRGIPADPGPQ